MRPKPTAGPPRTLLLALALLGAGTSTKEARSANLTVEIDGTGSHATIQAALDASQPGDTVRVGPGTYTGPGNRDLSFGGKPVFVVGTAGPSETILDCEGTEEEPHRGFLLTEGEGPDSRIAGFTVTGGFAAGHFPECYGGGILCIGSSPTIEDCWIIGNESGHFGGGMVCFEDASPTLRRVRFIDNTAVNNGGGFGSKMRCQPVLVDVVFAGNSAKRGGAFWAFKAGANIERATFYGNEAPIQAAGLWTNESDVWIRRSIIARSRGSEVMTCTHPRTVRVRDCILFDNEEGDALPRCVIDQGGNLSVDPLFVDPEGGDFRLRDDSPCIPEGGDELRIGARP